MLKKPVAIVLIIFLTAIAATSLAYGVLYTEKLFDDYALENTEYRTSNGQLFTVQFAAEDKVIAIFTEGKIIVANNTCSEGHNYNVCFKGLFFSHYNYSLPERIVNKAKLTIEAITAKINITRQLTGIMLLDQQQEIKTVLHNVGERAAENVAFYDQFPKEFDVYLTSDCQLSQNNVTWRGRLKANEKAQCSYVIKALKNTTFSSKASASYNNGIGMRSEETSTAIVVEPLSLQIAWSITNTSPDIGSEVAANLTIKALKNLSIEYFNVRLPAGLRIVKTDNAFAKTGDVLTYRAAMAANEEKVFQNKFVAELAGNRTMEASSRFKVEDFVQYAKIPAAINVSFKEPYVRLARTEFAKNADKLAIFITNPSSHTFHDITLTVKGAVEGNQTEEIIEGLSHKEYAYAFEKPDGEYNITTHLSYKTVFGQRFVSVKTEKITVNATRKKPETNATAQNQTQESEQARFDIATGIRKTGSIFLIFAAATILLIIAAVIAARLRKKESKAAEKETPAMSEPQKEEKGKDEIVAKGDEAGKG